VKKPTRAQQLAAALKSCRKRYPHSKKRRSACEREARGKFGAKKASARKGAVKKGVAGKRG
jgi:hypothetical protein